MFHHFCDLLFNSHNVQVSYYMLSILQVFEKGSAVQGWISKVLKKKLQPYITEHPQWLASQEMNMG